MKADTWFIVLLVALVIVITSHIIVVIAKPDCFLTLCL